MTRWLGWRGIVGGLVAIALGAWGVIASCNRAVAACKGSGPWPGPEGTLNRVGWALMLLGLAAVVGSVAAAIVRGVRR